MFGLGQVGAASRGLTRGRKYGRGKRTKLKDNFRTSGNSFDITNHLTGVHPCRHTSIAGTFAAAPQIPWAGTQSASLLGSCDSHRPLNVQPLPVLAHAQGSGWNAHVPSTGGRGGAVAAHLGHNSRGHHTRTR